MEKEDELLISKHIKSDDELRKYIEDHKRLETELEQFNKRVYLTPEEEMEKKKLQKRKLLGKDRIHEILSKYRQN